MTSSAHLKQKKWLEKTSFNRNVVNKILIQGSADLPRSSKWAGLWMETLTQRQDRKQRVCTKIQRNRVRCNVSPKEESRSGNYPFTNRSSSRQELFPWDQTPVRSLVGTRCMNRWDEGSWDIDPHRHGRFTIIAGRGNMPL